MPATLTQEELTDYFCQIPASAVGPDGEMPPVEMWPPYPVTLATLSQMVGVSMTTIERWTKRSNFPKRDSEGLIDAMEVFVWKKNRDEGLKHRCRHCHRLNSGS